MLDTPSAGLAALLASTSGDDLLCAGERPSVWGGVRVSRTAGGWAPECPNRRVVSAGDPTPADPTRRDLGARVPTRCPPTGPARRESAGAPGVGASRSAVV